MSIVISHFYQKAQSMASFLAKDFLIFFRYQKKIKYIFQKISKLFSFEKFSESYRETI